MRTRRESPSPGRPWGRTGRSRRRARAASRRRACRPRPCPSGRGVDRPRTRIGAHRGRRRAACGRAGAPARPHAPSPSVRWAAPERSRDTRWPHLRDRGEPRARGRTGAGSPGRNCFRIVTRAAFGLGRERTTTCRHVSVPDPTTSTSERRGALDAACAENEPSANGAPARPRTTSSAATVRAGTIHALPVVLSRHRNSSEHPAGQCPEYRGASRSRPSVSFVAPPSPLSP